MTHIKSSSNKIYKFIKSLAMKKARGENGCFIVEGIKSVTEALDSAVRVRFTVVSEADIKKCESVLQSAQKSGGDIYTVDERLFASMSDTKNPEGIMCVADMFSYGAAGEDDGLYVYCDGVSDPGNAGTLIRCADAVGAQGIIFSRGSVDIYNPKTVRATMGSLFHVKIYDGADCTVLEQMKKNGFRIYAGALDSTALDYDKAEYPSKTVIIIGNEANGVSERALSIADKPLIIPIFGRAESLNASVAGALFMYEWRKNNKIGE